MKRTKFNCLKMKENIQAKILEKTKNLSIEDEINYYEESLRKSDLATWVDKILLYGAKSKKKLTRAG